MLHCDRPRPMRAWTHSPAVGPTRASASTTTTRGRAAAAGMPEPTSRDEIGDRLASDRPGEPVPHFVLVCEYRGSHAEDHQLLERGVLRRLPRFAPHLVPAREHARVPMAAL